jgi:hypothetical protein
MSRPTMLMFRSPKEKTPGFYEVKVTNDGWSIDINKITTIKEEVYKDNENINKR